MNIFENQLHKYAEVAVKIGVNIQKGQTLVIAAPITSAEFVRSAAKVAYEAGAKHVYVEWGDDQLSLINFLYAPDEAMQEFPHWKAKGMEEWAEEGAAFLSILSPNPELLKEADPARVATYQKTAAAALEKFNDYRMNDQVSWTIVSVPNEEWATKIFQGTDEKEAVERLWQSIFTITRSDLEDPVQAWKEHNQYLKDRVDFLNRIGFKKLHYKAPGTDLTIELPEDHLWMGGSSTNKKGNAFFPNIPTEEVFTLPKKDGVNGTVASTKPLNYAGNLIDNFSFTFENGRIIDFSAETGYETLKQLVETDEGSHYLGEVALVPHDSPISNSDIVFYNTLFDENASCHLAIGKAYPFCLKNGKGLDKDELLKRGANYSLTHVDFMMGSDRLDIDGETRDGQIIPLFRNGNWVETN